MLIEFATSPACAPSILITFINMVLFKNAEPLENCGGTVYMFSGQVIIFFIHLYLNYLVLYKYYYVLGCSTKVFGNSSSFMCTSYVTCQTHLYYAATEKETCTSN